MNMNLSSLTTRNLPKVTKLITKKESLLDKVDKIDFALKEILLGESTNETSVLSNKSPGKKKRTVTPEGRAKMSEGQKKRWAAKRALEQSA